MAHGTLAFSVTTAASADTRRAVPSEDDAQAAVALLREAYDKQLSAADTAEEKRSLAHLLMNQASETTTSNDRYAFLKEARRLAVEAEDLETALAAIDRMADDFDIDPAREQASTLWLLSRGTRNKKLHVAIAKRVLALIDEAAQREQLGLAEKLIAFGIDNAREARNGALVDAIETKGRQLGPLAQQYAEVQKSRTILETKPLDGPANHIVGRWQCLLQGRWSEGLPMLVLGDDQPLRDLAKRDLQSPEDAPEQLAVADAWWDVAEQCDSWFGPNARQRAGLWYARALPLLTGLDRIRAAERLNEAGPIVSVVPEGVEPLDLSGLVLMMPFDQDTAFREDDGPHLQDLSRSENHGTVVGLEFDSGWIGSAGSFDGESTAVIIPRVVSEDFTISFWLKSAGSSRSGHQWHNGSGLLDGETSWVVDDFGVTLLGTRVAFGIGRPDTTIRSQTEVDESRWLHCCATRHRESGRIVLYIDGKPEATAIASTRELRSPPRLTIGQIQNGGRHFRGALDELAVFARCFTSEEVETLYLIGSRKISLATCVGLGGRSSEDAAPGGAERSTTVEADPEPPSAPGRHVLSGPNVIKLVDRDPVRAKVGWDGFWKNRAPEDSWPLLGPDFEFCNEFLYAHAPSRLAYLLPRGMLSFTAVGYCAGSRSVKFLVIADGETIFESEKSGIVEIRVDLPPRTKALELVVDDVGDKGGDQSFWCRPKLHKLKVEDLDKRGRSVSLTTLPPAAAKVGHGKLRVNKLQKSYHPIPVLYQGGGKCDEFFYAHANSEVVFDLPPGAERFLAVGYAMLSQSVMFRVKIDGKTLYESPRAGIVAIDVKIPSNAKQLVLETDNLGSGYADHAFWCYPRLHGTFPKGTASIH